MLFRTLNICNNYTIEYSRNIFPCRVTHKLPTIHSCIYY